ncbi:MAG: ArsB/NhaD family transporter [Candidatus Hydrogenedentales bacterium]
MSGAAVGSLVIFALTYVFIASERIDKTVAALLGASAVILVGFIPYHDALAAIDLNVILLLIGMMLVMSILSDTGVFEWLAVRIAKSSRGNGVVIFLEFMVVTAVLSAFLDNVTTVILLAPITILIAEILEIPPVPILILEAIASNIGGTSTLIGDPPNILIGSQAGLSFNEFIANLGPIILVICILVFPLMAIVYRANLHVAEGVRHRLERTRPERAILDPVSLRRGLIIFALMILGFFIGRAVGIEPGIVAIAGAMVMSLACRKDLHRALEKVEWNTVFFFIGLFMLIGSLEHNGIFERLATFMLEATGGNLLATVMTVLWFAAIMSAIVDNIPLVIAMIPLIQSMIPSFAASMGTLTPDEMRLQVEEPLFWALALGACLGGNGTLIGASANVVVSQIARRNNYNITFMGFTRYGFPIMIFTVAISTIYLYLRYF